MALLQSFNDSSAPKAKRRKLEHQESAPRTEIEDSDEEESVGSDQEGEDGDIDRVEEAEEDPAAGFDEQLEDEGSDEEDATDPFDTHFANPDQELVAKRVKAAQKGDWATKRSLVQTLRATITYPDAGASPEAPKPVSSLDGLKLKQKLKETASSKIGNLTAAQQNLSPVLFEYRDVLHCDRTVRNSDKIRQITCLHALNHVFK